ncbi:hypothetical protein [Halococcus qingdaonensis]|nr:hypothetical protein [Halococcus qingdaonensis]
MCHHRTTDSTRLYEDDEHEELPEWAIEGDGETDDEEEDEPEPFTPGTAD